MSRWLILVRVRMSQTRSPVVGSPRSLVRRRPCTTTGPLFWLKILSKSKGCRGNEMRVTIFYERLSESTSAPCLSLAVPSPWLPLFRRYEVHLRFPHLLRGHNRRWCLCLLLEQFQTHWVAKTAKAKLSRCQCNETSTMMDTL